MTRAGRNGRNDRKTEQSKLSRRQTPSCLHWHRITKQSGVDESPATLRERRSKLNTAAQPAHCRSSPASQLDPLTLFYKRPLRL